MEGIALGAKYAIFLAMELFVVGMLGAAVIAGLYHVVRERIREARRLDQVLAETKPTAPKTT
jgi:S-adenosylmethionine/arginine decarboxylase-like enzyme